MIATAKIAVVIRAAGTSRPARASMPHDGENQWA
jgi:hypothetical protein